MPRDTLNYLSRENIKERCLSSHYVCLGKPCFMKKNYNPKLQKQAAASEKDPSYILTFKLFVQRVLFLNKVDELFVELGWNIDRGSTF